MILWAPARLVVIAAVAWGVAIRQDASIAATIDRETATLGDRITLSVTVEHDSTETVAWATPEALGAFEVLDVQATDSTTVGGRILSMARYSVVAFELGELEVPPLEVGVTSVDGSSQILRTVPMTVTIQSVGLDDTGDIRAIKPPLDIARNWFLLLPWIVGVGVLGALGYWIYRRYRQRRGVETSAPVAPSRPAHEIAYEALDRLETAGLLERGEIKPYFIGVSEIIRTYLSGRYNIDAMDMTSHDVMYELERVPLNRQQLDLFATFFERSDLVKFAKYHPRHPACAEMISIARRLVDETLPLLPPMADGGTASAVAGESQLPMTG